MHGYDPAGILVDPGNRIRASFDAGADVELQHNFFAGVLGNDFNRPPPVHGPELRSVIVVPGAQTLRLEFLGRLVEALGDALPTVQALHPPSAGHHDELATDELVEFYRARKIFGCEGL